MFFPDDPQKQAMMMMALGLLGGAPQGRKNLGADIAHAGLLGMQGYQGAQGMQMRKAEEEQQREMRKMQMEQMRMAQEQAKREMGKQQQMDSLEAQFTRPGIAPLTPNDDQGFPMPSVPPSFDAQGFVNALPGVQGVQMRAQLAQMQQKESPFAKIDPKDYTPESIQKFSQSKNPGDLVPYRKPDGPQRGHVRDVMRGMETIQQEWTGSEWRDIGRGPRFKPDSGDKPPQPQLYEGPNGAVWITPPPRGQQATVPVTGPDGQPLGPKKGDKPLSEVQAKATLYTGMMQAAEDNVAKIKNFDPTKFTNQTWLAMARGDIPVLSKSAQNVLAPAPAQQYAQSTFQWTEAVLRQLTGAAAPEPEVWRQVKTYWPMPGDSAEVVKQKAASRKQVAEVVRVLAAGGAEKADAAVHAPQQELPDPLGIRR